MALLLTDLLALFVVALAAWKVVAVVRARFRPPAGAHSAGCSGCAGCTTRPATSTDQAPD
jgi:hypothetical protein